MLDFFVDWEPLGRAAMFGSVFLVALLMVLWIWYDTSPQVSSGRWAWRLIPTAIVLATIPALFVGAANLDQDRESLLKVVGWIGIGAGIATLTAFFAYLIWGKGNTEPEFFSEGVTEALPMPAPIEPPTIPGRRQAESRSARADAYLFVKGGPDQGKQFALGETNTIGRDAHCAVALTDRRISGEHAQVKKVGGHFTFLDLQATNGSYLVVEGREERLRNAQVLVHGDQVRMGHTILEFIDARRAGGH